MDEFELVLGFDCLHVTTKFGENFPRNMQKNNATLAESKKLVEIQTIE